MKKYVVRLQFLRQDRDNEVIIGETDIVDSQSYEEAEAFYTGLAQEATEHTPDKETENILRSLPDQALYHASVKLHKLAEGIYEDDDLTDDEDSDMMTAEEAREHIAKLKQQIENIKGAIAETPWNRKSMEPLIKRKQEEIREFYQYIKELKGKR